MNRLHLHLVSDSTGETLETVAKAALAQFDSVETIKHFWPMVRSEGHLTRIMADIAQNPGLILYTMVNADVRRTLEAKCRALGLPMVAAIDPVVHALSQMLGQTAKARPGGQHMLDAAYFARVEAIQYTIAHDDGVGHENWEEADILLAGVSRSSKTPTSIYLANRGYKTANIPIVIESPPPENLFSLKHPLVVVLAYMLINRVQGDIDFARKETQTVPVVMPARQLMQAVQAHRGVSQVVIGGNTAQASRLGELRVKVDAALKAGDAINAQIGEGLGSAPEWQAIRNGWDAVQSRAVTVSAPESFRIHSEYIVLVRDFITSVADKTTA